MRCHNCGAELQDNATFCPECNVPIYQNPSDFNYNAQPNGNNQNNVNIYNRCPFCGQEVYPNEQFCHNCGSSLTNGRPIADANSQSSYPAQNANAPQPQAPAPAKKANANKTAIIVVASLAAVILVAVVVLCIVLFGGKSSGEELKFSDYVNDSIVCDGTDGSGILDDDKTSLIDYDKLYNDLADDSSKAISQPEAYLVFDRAITISADKTENLSVGDTVNITYNINYDMINNDDNNFKNTIDGDDQFSKSYKVKDLVEVQKINPFDVIKSISYNSNNSKMSITYNENYSESYGKYTVEYGNNSLLISKEGDDIATVTFKASYNGDSEANVAAIVDEEKTDSGYKITPNTKNMTCKVKNKTTSAQTQSSSSKSYNYVTSVGQVNTSGSDYLNLYEQCMSNRSIKYPDAQFVCSYFVKNSNYLSTNAYNNHAINGINFVFYSESAGGYVTTSAFNLYISNGSIKKMNEGKYAGQFYNGRTVYPDEYDGYTNRIVTSQDGDRNWTSIEMIEHV